jgi:hypothetical protein
LGGLAKIDSKQKESGCLDLIWRIRLSKIKMIKNIVINQIQIIGKWEKKLFLLKDMKKRISSYC